MPRLTPSRSRVRLACLAPLLLVPAFLFQLAGPAVTEALRYEREAIVAGELWRLVSGHFVHLGWPHFAINAAATMVLAVGFGWHIRTPVSLLFLAGAGLALGVGGGLLLFYPKLEWYVGLSGILHGLAVLVAARVRRQEPVVGGVLLAGVILKVGWEQLVGTDPALANTIGGAVIVDAHLYGLIAGLVLHGLSWLTNRLLVREQP